MPLSVLYCQLDRFSINYLRVNGDARDSWLSLASVQLYPYASVRSC